MDPCVKIDETSLKVLSVVDDKISTLTLFVKSEAPRLFAAFGLPLILPTNPPPDHSAAILSRMPP
jgi:hypothetical protein